MKTRLILSACLWAAAVSTARAGMDGPAVDSARVPWACRVYWANVTSYDEAYGGAIHHTVDTQSGYGSGFLAAPGIVITNRHVVPGFTPSEGMTVLCGDQERTARVWYWPNALPQEPSLIGPGAALTSSPNDVAVLILDSAFDVSQADIPRLSRSRAESDRLLRGGNCVAFGWAGTDQLRSQLVKPVEYDHDDPEVENPRIGPPAWVSGPDHVVQYPGPSQEGDSGGPVICAPPSETALAKSVLVAVVAGMSTNGKASVYQRIDPVLPFLCDYYPGACPAAAPGQSARLSPSAAADAVAGARRSAGTLAGD